MKETTKEEEPLKNPKSVFKLIKNDKWQPPRQPKKRIKLIFDKELPPAA